MSERGSLEGNILIVAMSKIQWQWGRFINPIDWFYRQTRGMKSGMICPSQWKRFTCCGKGMSMHMTTKRTHHHHQAKSAGTRWYLHINYFLTTQDNKNKNKMLNLFPPHPQHCEKLRLSAPLLSCRAELRGVDMRPCIFLALYICIRTQIFSPHQLRPRAASYM